MKKNIEASLFFRLCGWGGVGGPAAPRLQATFGATPTALHAAGTGGWGKGCQGQGGMGRTLTNWDDENIFEHFHPYLLGEIIHFVEYFSNRLKPPRCFLLSSFSQKIRITATCLFITWFHWTSLIQAESMPSTSHPQSNFQNSWEYVRVPRNAATTTPNKYGLVKGWPNHNCHHCPFW